MYGFISFKVAQKTEIVTLIFNADVYIETLNNFLIKSIEIWIIEDEGIFLDYDKSCRKAKGINFSLRKGI